MWVQLYLLIIYTIPQCPMDRKNNYFLFFTRFLNNDSQKTISTLKLPKYNII